MTREILFFASFLLIISLFSEESARALRWLRDRLKLNPRYRLIIYPLLFVLLVGAGIIIATSLIDFAAGPTFSYD